jgi:hypothetical protein
MPLLSLPLVENNFKELWSEIGAVLLWLDGFDGPLAYLKGIKLPGYLSLYFLLLLPCPLCVKKGVKVRLPNL